MAQSHPRLEWLEPAAGTTAFPRVKDVDDTSDARRAADSRSRHHRRARALLPGAAAHPDRVRRAERDDPRGDDPPRSRAARLTQFARRRGCAQRGVSRRSLSARRSNLTRRHGPLEPLSRSPRPPFDLSASNLSRLGRTLATRDPPALAPAPAARPDDHRQLECERRGRSGPWRKRTGSKGSAVASYGNSLRAWSEGRPSSELAALRSEPEAVRAERWAPVACTNSARAKCDNVIAREVFLAELPAAISMPPQRHVLHLGLADSRRAIASGGDR